MIEDCDLGHNTIIYHPDLVNLYGCEIGSRTTVGPFVEIQRGVTVGRDCKISSHTFICDGVDIGDWVFIGHNVCFVNDLYPAIAGPFVKRETLVEDDVVIGSGATILPVTIGRGSIIGAGAVVTQDVPPNSIVVGNPARVVRQFGSLAERQEYIDEQCNPVRALP